MSLVFLLSFLTKFHSFLGLILFFIWIYISGEWKKNFIYFLMGLLFLWVNPPNQMLCHPSFARGYIEIEEAKNISKGVQYKGTLKGLLCKDQFYPMDKKISFQLPKESLTLDDYLVDALYTERSAHFITLSKVKKFQKIANQSLYKKIKTILSQKLNPHLQIQSTYKQGESLLLACLFGNPISKEIKILFSKLGLSHILAISGFHFSIAAFFISAIFRLFFPKKIVQVTLAIILTLYFILIGSSSSIFRAYISLLLAIIGTLFDRKNTALNLLFVTLLLAFFFDPYALQNAAFQLSYAATFGLITFCPIMENFLDRFYPKRSFDEAKRLHQYAAIFYILLQIFKKIFSVNFSAFLFTLPIIFYHFQMISILGLIYNLFIPTIIGFALTIGLVGFFLKAFFNISFIYLSVIRELDYLISFLFYYPRKWDFTLFSPCSAAIFTIIVEITLCFGSLFLYSKLKFLPTTNK